MNDQGFRDHLDQVKAAVRGTDIAAALGLRQRGKRFFCPSCQADGGKTPDFSVFDQGFKCFKCGLTGDLIDLAALAGGMSKADAIAYLEGRAGIARPGRGAPGQGSRRKAAPGPARTPSRASQGPGRAGIRASGPGQAAGAAADHSGLYAAFLGSVCLPIQGTPGASYLEGRGIPAGVADRYGVRYCADLAGLWKLADRGTIKAAGLSSLFVFQKAALPFLAFPYVRQGKPVFIKTRALLSKGEADRRALPRFLNTGGTVPCLWNHDAVAASGEVMIAEGEIDALSAIVMDLVAVGLPGWSHWKDAWTRDFAGKEVILALDADEAGQKGAADIAWRFLKAGLPCPRQYVSRWGKDLNDVLQHFMKDGKQEGIKA
jgi:hypothetical protein